MKFSELPLKLELLQAIEAVGYEKPSQIQEEAIPLIIDGRDIVGQSQTGTGKTAAFMLPLIQRVTELNVKGVKALVMLPTRELAIQVATEARKFSQFIDGVRVVPIYGGESIEKQIKELRRGCDIVVGTPGRIMDHIRRRTLRFDVCETIVLDEADEMLNMGFYEDIIEVLSHLPEEKQTILFSATMPKPILELTKNIQKDPAFIKIKATSLTVSSIKQVCYEINPNSKSALLLQLLQLNQPQSAMIFCNTKKMVDELTSDLNNASYPAAALHGDMKQEMRSAVMHRFKEKKINVLIATDVAARGIDVENVDLVVNYDIPQELEYYVHRIGRTGRAGKSGLAITLYTPRQNRALQLIERIAKCSIEKLPLPSKEDLSGILSSQLSGLVSKWKDRSSKYTEEIFSQLLEDGHTQEDILNALVNRYIDENSFKPLDRPERASRTREGKAPRERNYDRDRNQDFAKIMISVGDRQGVAAAHIVSAIAESCNISGREIGKIKIEQRSSIVEIPAAKEKEILAALTKTTIKGKPIFVTAIRKDGKNTETRKPKGDNRRDKGNRRSRNHS